MVLRGPFDFLRGPKLRAEEGVEGSNGRGLRETMEVVGSPSR